jgi:hypothetical protein
MLERPIFAGDGGGGGRSVEASGEFSEPFPDLGAPWTLDWIAICEFSEEVGAVLEMGMVVVDSVGKGVRPAIYTSYFSKKKYLQIFFGWGYVVLRYFYRHRY